MIYKITVDIKKDSLWICDWDTFYLKAGTSLSEFIASHSVENPKSGITSAAFIKDGVEASGIELADFFEDKFGMGISPMDNKDIEFYRIYFDSIVDDREYGFEVIE